MKRLFSLIALSSRVEGKNTSEIASSISSITDSGDKRHLRPLFGRRFPVARKLLIHAGYKGSAKCLASEGFLHARGRRGLRGAPPR